MPWQAGQFYSGNGRLYLFDIEFPFFVGAEYEAFLKKGLVFEIDDEVRIEIFAVYAHFEMQVVGGGASRLSGYGDRLSGCNAVARIYHSFGGVGVNRFHAAIMPDDNDVAVSACRSRHADNSVEGCEDRVVFIDFDVDSGVVPAPSGSVRGNHSGSR